jgi:hypothetical protein
MLRCRAMREVLTTGVKVLEGRKSVCHAECVARKLKATWLFSVGLRGSWERVACAILSSGG